MANVVEFTLRGVDQFSKAGTSVAKSLGNLTRTTVKVGAAVTAAGGAVVFFANRMANAQDRVGKFATRIGVSSEALSKMEFAASQAGVAASQFDMAAQRMTRRVGEAAQGLGEAREALVTLGIDAKNFATLGLDEQMAILADRMENAGGRAEQLRLAFKLFDSEGTAVLQMLKEGSDEMRAMAKDAEFLGVAIGSDAAANAELFNDEFGRVQASLKGVGLAISQELMPILSGMFRGFANFVAENRGRIVNFIKGAIVGFTTFGLVVGQVASEMKNKLNEAFTTEGFDRFIDGAVSAFKWLGNFLLDVGPVMAQILIKYWQVAWETFTEMGSWAWKKVLSLFGGEDVPSLGGVLFRSIPEATEQLRGEIDALWSDLTERGSIAGEEMVRSVSEFLGINIEAARAQAEAWLEQFSLIADVTEERQNMLQEKSRTYFEELRAQADALVKEQQSLTKELSKFTLKTIKDFSKGVGQMFANVIFESENLGKALKNLLKEVLKQVVATLIEIGVRRLILNRIITTAVGSEAGAEAGKAIGLTFANTMASVSGAPFPISLTAPAVAAAHSAAASAGFSAGMASGQGLGAAVAGARADGGPVSVGRTFLVGERGPELFTPRANGNILPNEALGGGGGNITIESLQIDILPNATNAEALMDMSPVDMEELVAAKVIPALNALRRYGVSIESDEER